jgi:hypothetical protein
VQEHPFGEAQVRDGRRGGNAEGILHPGRLRQGDAQQPPYLLDPAALEIRHGEQSAGL